MQVTIEIPVRASEPGETLEQMNDAASKEAEGILRNKLGQEFRIAGPVTFSYAVIK